jgi:hypothetical protein
MPQLTKQLPIVEMLTTDEMNHSMARTVLIQKNICSTDGEADALIEASELRVSLKNVKLPDGKTYVFATIGLFPKGTATKTPLPEKKTDGA